MKRGVGILVALAGLAAASCNFVAAENDHSTASTQPVPELDHVPSFPGAEGHGSRTRGGYEIQTGRTWSRAKKNGQIIGFAIRHSEASR